MQILRTSSGDLRQHVLAATLKMAILNTDSKRNIWRQFVNTGWQISVGENKKQFWINSNILPRKLKGLMYISWEFCQRKKVNTMNEFIVCVIKYRFINRYRGHWRRGSMYLKVFSLNHVLDSRMDIKYFDDFFTGFSNTVFCFLWLGMV